MFLMFYGVASSFKSIIWFANFGCFLSLASFNRTKIGLLGTFTDHLFDFSRLLKHKFETLLDGLLRV